LPLAQGKQADLALLRAYPRAFAHMRRQFDSDRLELIIGSGASQPLGFPSWKELVERIANHPTISGGHVFNHLYREAAKPLPIISEVLFQRFRERHIDEIRRRETNPSVVLRLLVSRWLDVIHECLYAGIAADDGELLARDNLYEHFLDVVRRAQLTVNYNFDDSLQRLLLFKRTEDQRKIGRGFETTADPTLQFGLRRGVIYHPNGHLPFNRLERTSDRLVFSEESFADQLMDTMSGVYSSLIHHLSKNTCLLMGLSLEDETLRHLLRQSARLSPGHFHYYVQYVDSTTVRNQEAEQHQVRAFFDAYNLLTLFLDAEGIAALGRCLLMVEHLLQSRVREANVPLHFTYYITGVPGAGKTTTVSHFKDLVTFDEWLDERLPNMARPHDELNP
jgi:hypothetical protein